MSPLSGQLDGPWAGDITFARARRSVDPAGVDLAIVGVPFDMAVTNRAGARFGPRAIREQSLLAGEFPWPLWPWDFDPFETHVVVDIDFLDPAYAPGTGTPVAGGPTTAEARRLLRRLAGLRIVGADQVEVAPAYDGPGQITALAAATLALDLVHLILHPAAPA